jgi:hypothetical protein
LTSVRGSSSGSYLTITNTTVRFHGTLETHTLGGADFRIAATIAIADLDLTPSSARRERGVEDGQGKVVELTEREVSSAGHGNGAEERIGDWGEERQGKEVKDGNGTTPCWDPHVYDGIRLRMRGGAGKKFTLVLKDSLEERGADGRLNAAVGWQGNFIGGVW